MHSETVTPKMSKSSMNFSAKYFAKGALGAVISTAVGLVAWLFAQGQSEAQLYSVASVLVTVSITSLGFLFTAASIFAALFTRDLVQKLMRTGHYKNLVTLIFITAIAFLVSAVMSLASMFASGVNLLTIVSVSVGLASAAILLFCVAGHQFYLVLSNVE
jgi:hypothetical protein